MRRNRCQPSFFCCANLYFSIYLSCNTGNILSKMRNISTCLFLLCNLVNCSHMNRTDAKVHFEQNNDKLEGTTAILQLHATSR